MKLRVRNYQNNKIVRAVKKQCILNVSFITIRNKDAKKVKMEILSPTTYLMQTTSCKGIQESVLLLNLRGDPDETNWQTGF